MAHDRAGRYDVPWPRLVKPYLEEMYENELDEMKAKESAKRPAVPTSNARLETRGEGKENDEDHERKGLEDKDSKRIQDTQNDDCEGNDDEKKVGETSGRETPLHLRYDASKILTVVESAMCSREYTARRHQLLSLTPIFRLTLTPIFTKTP